jgi:hypothetical protein
VDWNFAQIVFESLSFFSSFLVLPLYDHDRH